MQQTEIHRMMHELEKQIGCEFDNIDWLASAMESTEIARSGNKRSYTNETLSVVGDALIKLFSSIYLYQQECYPLKGDLTEAKKKLESNKVFYKIVEGEGLRKYTFNQSNFYGKGKKILRAKEERHDPYIEAIAAAIYYDKGYEYTMKWWEQWLLPLILKHTENNQT